jgi:hypothetical protein
MEMHVAGKPLDEEGRKTGMTCFHLTLALVLLALLPLVLTACGKGGGGY